MQNVPNIRHWNGQAVVGQVGRCLFYMLKHISFTRIKCLWYLCISVLQYLVPTVCFKAHCCINTVFAQGLDLLCNIPKIGVISLSIKDNVSPNYLHCFGMEYIFFYHSVFIMSFCTCQLSSWDRFFKLGEGTFTFYKHYQYFITSLSLTHTHLRLMWHAHSLHTSLTTFSCKHLNR